MGERAVLIAGPGQHFAYELASEFAYHGYDVALAGRNTDQLDALASRLSEDGVPSFLVKADFSDLASVEVALERCSQELPPWSSLIYNVKHSPTGDALTTELHELEHSLGSNVLGALYLSRIALQAWERDKEASILLSGGGYKDAPDPNKLGLSVSKGALHSMALAMEPVFRDQGVAVKEVVIDGVVRPEGPIYPEELAKLYWYAHSNNSSETVFTISA
ncbi:MAG TPA: SDR family NAD(P)-dependent oxidoreductase [Candidatus Limnocylindria bacterium]|nr:SDR family NAD(P)-dependent oxidoreductase [Candidatus Limnocylindria bacterium]